MLLSGTSSFHGTIADKNKPIIKATESNSDETLKKILSVVMKIKYDVENISHNQARMDNSLTETIMNMGSISSSSHENTNSNDDNDYCLLLPLHNEDELNNFEEKLLNKSFRLNAVNGLKRLAKKSLTSTVRQMMRKIFDDEFLQIFSYVGQKKKKYFLH
uniref:DUF4806 domain-containing protein n=1 Tax=Schizaphis graminum TaxID=13262 RepID=A0A2S2NTZ0_SCHGA